MSEQPTLKRSISLWQATLTGIGLILGAGIYALIGNASASGMLWNERMPLD